MNTVIRKIGNSEGVILPRELLTKLNLRAGDSFTIVERGNGIDLIPSKTDIAEQLKAAREGMAKYKVALRELAK